MAVRLEHANLVVRDLEAVVAFVRAAFPDFRVRAEGVNSDDGVRWVHVGTDDTYLALNEASDTSGPGRVPYSGRPGTNHLGYEVGDVEGVRRRLAEAGYEDSTYPNDHPARKRVYFHDPEGNDWEFVQYFTDDPAERNDYKLPG